MELSHIHQAANALPNQLFGNFVKLCGVHRKPSHGMASKTVLAGDLAKFECYLSNFIMVILTQQSVTPNILKSF